MLVTDCAIPILISQDRCLRCLYSTVSKQEQLPKKWMPLISNAIWKILQCRWCVGSFFFILFPAIGINLQPMPKIVFRTCFMKEKQREYVFHNRQKLNCQCPAQSKAFTCFSMQSTLRCERWLTSFDKRTALRATIHTSQREASQVTAKSRKSLLRDHEQISCTNKCLPLCAEIMQINF